MFIEQFIGIFAGCSTTISFIPQLVKTCKTKKVEGISAFWVILHSCGVGSWVIYGILLQDPLLILFNAVATFLDLIFLRQIYLYSQVQEDDEDDNNDMEDENSVQVVAPPSSPCYSNLSSAHGEEEEDSMVDVDLNSTT